MEYEYYETELFVDGEWKLGCETLALDEELAARHAIVEAVKEFDELAGRRIKVRSRMVSDMGHVDNWTNYALTVRKILKVYQDEL